MRLRELKMDDAPFMLEWMHDEDVVADLRTDFSRFTLEDCTKFIAESVFDEENLHMAVVDQKDEYMGTVSLKHQNLVEGFAEFAITMRKEAMGRGFASFGMKRMLATGFALRGLKEIIWCVSEDNKRAIRFYDKHEYKRINEVPGPFLDCYLNQKLIWYGAKAE